MEMVCPGLYPYGDYLFGCCSKMTLAAIMASTATSQESSARALKANAEPIATTPMSINPMIVG